MNSGEMDVNGGKKMINWNFADDFEFQYIQIVQRFQKLRVSSTHKAII